MRNSRIANALRVNSIAFKTAFDQLHFKSNIRQLTERDFNSAKAVLLDTVMNDEYLNDITLSGKKIGVKDYPYGFLSSTGTVDGLVGGFKNLIAACAIITKSFNKQRELSNKLIDELKTDVIMQGDEFTIEQFISTSKIIESIQSEVFFLARALNEYPLSNHAELKVLAKVDEVTRHIEFSVFVTATKPHKDIALTASKDQLKTLTDYLLNADLSLLTTSIPFYAILNEVGHDYPRAGTLPKELQIPEIEESFDLITAEAFRQTTFLNMGFKDFKHSPLDIYKLLLP